MNKNNSRVEVWPTPQKRILWLTNMAAPYRVPVWEHIGRHYDLCVGLLESNATLLADISANRGQDWHHKTPSSFAYKEIPTIKIRRGESRYYLLRRVPAVSSIRQLHAIVFGGWESPAYWAFLAAAIVFRVRRVGFYESPLSTMRYKRGPAAWARSTFFKLMHAIVVPGPAAQQALLAVGVRPEKILVGFNAVDVAAIHQAANAQTSEAGAAHGHTFLYVGQLIERKRVAAIVEAFAQVANPDDHLRIVGAGELEQQLREEAGRSGMNISFIPYIANKDLPAVLAECETLVLASSQEVWGLVVNEALAAGMHVVVTSNCGVAPSVDGMAGVFVAQPDLTDLAQEMKASRDDWSGRISKPAILEYTPERFAAVFESALLRGGV